MALTPAAMGPLPSADRRVTLFTCIQELPVKHKLLRQRPTPPKALSVCNKGVSAKYVAGFDKSVLPEITMNNKFYALALMGALAGGAFAQSSPPGVAVPPNTPGIASDKAQRAGEARKDMREKRSAKTPSATGGDTSKVAEGGAIGTDKAAIAGEARAETRDVRRPGRRKTTQGGTPK